MASIKSSELITNEDGSIFHLHLLPEDLADDIILVGDPAGAPYPRRGAQEGWTPMVSTPLVNLPASS